MKKIFVLSVRTTDTEWSAIAAYETKETAENKMQKCKEWDTEMKLSIEFLYKIEEIHYFLD